jgi:hypothetical protein
MRWLSRACRSLAANDLESPHWRFCRLVAHTLGDLSRDVRMDLPKHELYMGLSHLCSMIVLSILAYLFGSAAHPNKTSQPESELYETHFPLPQSPAVAATTPRVSVAGTREAPAREVTLIAPVQYPVTIRGTPSGTIALPAGTHVQFVSVRGGSLVVQFAGSTATIPAAATDFGRMPK